MKSNSSKTEIPDLFVSKGKAFSGLNEITLGFNDYFENVGPKLASSIPGFILDSCECEKVIPIFKSGATCDFTNYRPISLLSSFSKLLEKLVSYQMFRFVDKYNIIYSHQYGLRPKHNTSHPLYSS